jgi:hypothetical protein
LDPSSVDFCVFPFFVLVSCVVSVMAFCFVFSLSVESVAFFIFFFVADPPSDEASTFFLLRFFFLQCEREIYKKQYVRQDGCQMKIVHGTGRNKSSLV